MATKLRYLGEEELAVEQVGELHQALLHCCSPTLLHIQVPAEGRLSVTWEKDPLRIPPVVQEGNAGSHEITGHVHHLRHQVCGRGRGQGQGS